MLADHWSPTIFLLAVDRDLDLTQESNQTMTIFIVGGLLSIKCNAFERYSIVAINQISLMASELFNDINKHLFLLLLSNSLYCTVSLPSFNRPTFL